MAENRTWIGVIQTEEDCRRLVAAWNLCDGTATELIEAAPSLGRLIVEHLEMLEALKDVIVGDITFQQIRDIIAKVEGRT